MQIHRVRVHRSDEALPPGEQLAGRIAAVAAEHLDRAAQAGHGEDDMAALFKGVTHD